MRGPGTRRTLLLFLTLLVAPVPVGAQQTRLETLNVSFHTLVPSYAPFWIAKDKGFFEKYGLDVRFTYIASSAIAFSALISGDVHLTTVSSAPAMAALARGAPVAIVAAFGPTRFKLVAHSSITSLQALKGKTIGNSRPGGSVDFAIQRLVRKLGLVAGKDVQVLTTGVQESRRRIMLISQGKVDATIATAVDISELEQKGYKFNVLADLTELGIYGSGAVVCVTRRFLADHRPTVRAFLMAFSEGIWMGKTQKKVAFETFRKFLKVDEPRLFEGWHKQYILEQIPAKPFPLEEAMLSDIEDLSVHQPELKGKRLSEFVDVSILKELEREGFFSRLHR
ncbi:MAG: ABC transporter substrate-binding protein [Candidatus Binatia bacterium]